MADFVPMRDFRSGKLLVIDDAVGSGRAEVRCDCGNILIVQKSLLLQNKKQSCSCTWEISRIKHGKCGTPEYSAWRHMLERCYNSKTKGFENYGGRGIIVYERWKEDFTAFLTDMGE